MIQSGPRNLITDVPGLLVGQAEDEAGITGTTVVLCNTPAAAAVDVRGGAPGSRETELLDPVALVGRVDAIVLSGGSAFGLDAASGVQAYLREQGRGFAIRDIRIPIVCGAVLFDMLNGGDKNWGRFPPYRELGYAAAAAAVADKFGLGSVGAGLGATTANLKGGVGSASAQTRGGHTVAALAVVNAAGSAVVGDGPWFWAAPFERGREFGGRGFPENFPAEALAFRTKGSLAESTTLAVVATDAELTKTQARRLALMAQDGLARAIRPVHTPLDGDVVFAAATGARALGDPIVALAELGALAADVLALAVARGVYEATALPFAPALPAWRDRFT